MKIVSFHALKQQGLFYEIKKDRYLSISVHNIFQRLRRATFILLRKYVLQQEPVCSLQEMYI